MALNNNREHWLESAIDLHLKGMFAKSGHRIPEVRVSVGLPYGRGGRKAIGQHWCPEASDDKKGAIFISPTIDDSIVVLTTLVHELVHAVAGNEHKHGPYFGEIALSVGLMKPMRSTPASEELKAYLEWVVQQIGPYPHAKLNLLARPTPKQATRMIKMECMECGYICRATKKYIMVRGAALCPCNGAPMEVAD